MDIRERYAQLVEELMEGVDNGDFNDVTHIPSKYTYEFLAAFCYYARQLDGGEDFFRQLHHLVSEAGAAALREKISRGEKVKVTFLAISAAEWPADALYHLLEKDERFDVTVTNCVLADRSIDDRTKTYLQNKEFFESRGYRVLDTYDAEKDEVHSWEQLCEVPDMVIHLTYWWESLPECYRILHYPLRRINLSIPYGFETGNSAGGQYASHFAWNKEFQNLAVRVYANTKMDVEGYRQYQLLQGSNVAYSGYVKMDYFYQKPCYTESDIRALWKIPEGADVNSMKKVIIAPHHSFLGYAGILFSTFAENVHFWPYLAEKYQDKISFVLKPHPNLRCRAVEAGVFKSTGEYDAYIAKWNRMPNARVVEEGSYLELFATSDAMIMDSISFIAEYLYADKPLLYLTRPEQVFTELGQKCMSAYSQAEGSDYMKIERFLEDTVLGESDSMREQRRKIFAEELDYVKDHHCLASEWIYQDIASMVGTE